MGTIRHNEVCRLRGPIRHNGPTTAVAAGVVVVVAAAVAAGVVVVVAAAVAAAVVVVVAAVVAATAAAAFEMRHADPAVQLQLLHHQFRRPSVLHPIQLLKATANRPVG